MNNNSIQRPGALWMIITLLIILAVGGISGGVSMLLDPSGYTMGMPYHLLGKLPVENYVLPGLFLLLIFGLVPIAIAAVLAMRQSHSSWLNTVAEGRTIWGMGIALSIALILWIAIQVYFMGYSHIFQLAFGLIGVALLVLFTLKPIRSFLNRTDRLGV